MSELQFKIMPRFIDGVDQAPETARKTEKVYIQHEIYAIGIDGIPYVVGVDETEEDVLLNDPCVVTVADKLQLAEELIQAAIEDGGLV